MDPAPAISIVCSLAHRLHTGPDSAILPHDAPLLMELVGIDHFDYEPRFMTRYGFLLLVERHFFHLGVDARFLTAAIFRWMLMIFERLLVGEITLPAI